MKSAQRLSLPILILCLITALAPACKEEAKTAEATSGARNVPLDGDIKGINLEGKMKCDSPCKYSEFIVEDYLDTAVFRSVVVGPNGFALGALPQSAKLTGLKRAGAQGWERPNAQPLTTGPKGDYLEVPVHLDGQQYYFLLHKDFVRQLPTVLK